jgi:hypothetical protein
VSIGKVERSSSGIITFVEVMVLSTYVTSYVLVCIHVCVCVCVCVFVYCVGVLVSLWQLIDRLARE